MTSPPDTKNPAPDSEALLRAEVASHLERGDTPRACQAARALLLTSPTLRSARALRNALETHVERNPLLKPIRVALLSSFSSEFLHNHLIARGLASGLAVDIYQGGFGLFRQEILDPDSAPLSRANRQSCCSQLKAKTGCPRRIAIFSASEPRSSTGS